MTKLSVPSRFETDLLEDLHILNRQYGCIKEVYGTLPYSILGHARPTRPIIRFGDFKIDRVKEFASQAHSLGIEVNYLANATCLGELTYGGEGRGKIVRYLESVYEAGVDTITVATPYLVRLVKSEFPSLKVQVSVKAYIESVQKLSRWEELGADIINLPAEINRDFTLLDAISKSSKVDVELLVNESCLFDCPYALYHQTLTSHGSKHRREGYLDYCMLECTMDRLEEPAELLRAGWIRPEDTEYYEKRFGVKRFKIQGRQMPVDWILNVVEAYSKRRYKGNLLYLISPTYPDWSLRSSPPKQVLEKYGVGSLKPPDIYIDNSRLDEFFKTIVEKGGCGDLQQCKICGYCDRIAKDLVQIRDKRQFETYTSATKMLFEEMVPGAFSLAD